MKTLLTITAILLGVSAQCQHTLPSKTNPEGATLLNVSGRFSDTTVFSGDTVKLTETNLTHLSGRIVNGYEKLIINPTQYSGLTFNQNHWVVKSTQANNFSDLEINSKYEKPITFTIDDVVYLVYQKKVYRLLK